MRTSNPVFNSNAYQSGIATSADGRTLEAAPKVMTVSGTAWKTAYLLAITAATAAASWNYFMTHPQAIMWAVIGSLVAGLVGGFVMLRAAKIAHYIVPVFAFSEGIFVAAISVAVVAYSPLAAKIGSEAEAFMLIGQAAGLTMAIAGVALLGYGTGVLRLGPMAMKVIGVMTAGVMFYYLGAWIVNMIFGGGTIPRLGWDAGPIGIGFSLFVVVLASLNLLMDFQFVEAGAQRRAPKHMEWVAAFGLLTTLVWLYIEVLRLLAKLRK